MKKLWLIAGCGFLLAWGGPASAAPTNEQKCQAAKLKEAGKYYLCRMKEEARAAKKAEEPNFTRCDDKFEKKWTNIEAKFGLACGEFSDLEAARSVAMRDAGDLACRLRGEGRVRRHDFGGSIVSVHFAVDAAYTGTIVRLRNLSNMLAHARCVYVDSSCVMSAEFTVEIPLQSEVEWVALLGQAGIPLVPTLPFSGEIVCVQVDATGVDPFPGNSLIVSMTGQNVCAEDGRGVEGGPYVDADGNLCLGGGPPTPECGDAEFEPCSNLGRPFEPSVVESCSLQTPTFRFICQ